jgi:molybdopterin-guanine dinucleotide biosynthesis protein A
VLTAIVLAGGRSSRMGTPKALLPFDGEPLILHIVRRLQPRFDELVVVAAPGQALPPMPVTLVHDEVAFQGPVGGIRNGLEAALGEFAFVTSCDAAFSSPALMSHLLSLRDDNDVVVPRWDDRFQPLFAVYRRTVLPILDAQLASGELRPVYLFDKVRTRTVDEDEVRRFDPDGVSFFNMNRPQDYAEALLRWRALHASSTQSGSVSCIVELFGVARLLAGVGEVPLTLGPGATLADAFDAVSRRFPSLMGSVILAGALAEGYACNVNGLEFVRSPAAPVRSGDRILIVSADAGG